MATEVVNFIGSCLVITVAIIFLPVFFLVSLFKSIFEGRWNRLNGKTVLVTGAGNGLGREMARQLARLDCKVLCVDMKKDDLAETVQMIDTIDAKPGQARAYVCDITDTKRIASLRDEILKEFGKLDMLINNAAFLYLCPLDYGDDKFLQRCMDVNVLGATWMTRAFLPSMKKNKSGQIVFVNSVAGLSTDKSIPLYAMGKHALSALAYSLDDELQSNPEWRNIKVSSAHPAFIASNPRYKELYRSNIPTLSVEFTASSVLDGARRGLLEYAVPGGEFGTRLTLILSRILPRAFQRLVAKACAIEIAHCTDQSLIEKFTSPDCSHKTLFDDLGDVKSKIVFLSDEKLIKS